MSDPSSVLVLWKGSTSRAFSSNMDEVAPGLPAASQASSDNALYALRAAMGRSPLRRIQEGCPGWATRARNFAEPVLLLVLLNLSNTAFRRSRRMVFLRCTSRPPLIFTTAPKSTNAPKSVVVTTTPLSTWPTWKSSSAVTSPRWTMCSSATLWFRMGAREHSSVPRSRATSRTNTSTRFPGDTLSRIFACTLPLLISWDSGTIAFTGARSRPSCAR
mmetsp:Transcript_4644/g.18534  ORF Transcript_4644/g.18534 Transcript_4644/m.18534 type:complete len:217 (+) Transcript_4644:1804-2454(+)